MCTNTGDNHPFFADVNQVLADLFPGMQLFGNTRGQVVMQAQEVADGPGIVPSYINTGIAKLFEGETIASVDPQAVRAVRDANLRVLTLPPTRLPVTDSPSCWLEALAIW
jgi:hypothetical protein